MEIEINWVEFAEYIARVSSHMISEYAEDGEFIQCPFSTRERALAAFQLHKAGDKKAAEALMDVKIVNPMEEMYDPTAEDDMTEDDIRIINGRDMTYEEYENHLEEMREKEEKLAELQRGIAEIESKEDDDVRKICKLYKVKYDDCRERVRYCIEQMISVHRSAGIKDYYWEDVVKEILDGDLCIVI